MIRYIAGPDALVESIGRVDIQATREDFIVCDNFIAGNEGISYVGKNFLEWFGGKVEQPTEKKTLFFGKLKMSHSDIEILAELGTDVKIMLSQVFALIKMQKSVASSVLINTNRVNLFYIYDPNALNIGGLRVVVIRRISGGLYIEALQLNFGRVIKWEIGTRLFWRAS